MALTTSTDTYSRVLLDSYARRHEGQKIYLRQAAAQRWVENRDTILQGGRPHPGVQSMLRACDQQLRAVCCELHSLGQSLTNKPPGARSYHRRRNLRGAALLRPPNGPLGGRGPEPQVRAALASLTTTLSDSLGPFSLLLHSYFVDTRLSMMPRDMSDS